MIEISCPFTKFGASSIVLKVNMHVYNVYILKVFHRVLFVRFVLFAQIDMNVIMISNINNLGDHGVDEPLLRHHNSRKVFPFLNCLPNNS